MANTIDTPGLRTEARQLVIGMADLHGLHRKIGMLAALLLLAHCGAMAMKYYAGNDIVFGLVPMFDFYEEHNAPTYFSSLNLLLTALLLFAIARLTRDSGQKTVHAWRILGAGFVFMSVDEFADLRMILAKVAKGVGANLEAVPLLSVAWTVPVAAVVLVLTVYFIPFLLRLKTVYTVNFAIAGAGFVLAAIGFETIEGLHVVQTRGVRDLAFMFMVTIEETLEIFSILYFQYFLLRYLNEYHRNVFLRLNY